MSTTSPSSPPKRPRLSLQIKALANGPSGRTSRCLAAAVDVKSPTAFNTLSNVYATAVDRSTPVQENPPTAILGRRPVLRLRTQDVAAKDRGTHTPYLGPYLDTPLTAQPISPAVAKEIYFPSAVMTATPPLSAQPPEQSGAQVFTFDGATPATAVPPGAGVSAPAPQNPKRRTTMPAAGSTKLPYTHPRSLRSILRNSPLPPLSTRSPESPRRQSLRLQEKAARRVAYNSPLTQEITTSKYTKSHIDLLAEDATPISPSTSSSDDGDSLLDQAMADGANTRDGGQTPGPFEEMRRRMANMHASTPMALSPTGGGIRKRGGKRKEKKRRWVWTIGQDEEADEGEAAIPAEAGKKGATPAVPVLAVPAPRPRTRSQQAQAQLAKAVAAAQHVQAQARVPLLTVPVPPLRHAPAAAPAAPPTSSVEAPPVPATAPQSQHCLQQKTLSQQPQQQQHHPHCHDKHPPQTREATPIPPSLLPTRHSTPDDSLPASAPNTRPVTPEPLTATTTHPAPTLHAMSVSLLSPPQQAARAATAAAEPPTPSVASTVSAASSSSLYSSRRGDLEDSDYYSSGDGDVEMSDASSVVEDNYHDREVQEKKMGYERRRYSGSGSGSSGSGSSGSGSGPGPCFPFERDGNTKGAVPGGGDAWAGRGLHDQPGSGGFADDGDVEMDGATPTMTARPLEGRSGAGWAPWAVQRVGEGSGSSL